MAFSGGVFSLIKNWVWYRAPHQKTLSDMLAAEFAGIATALGAPQAGSYKTSSGSVLVSSGVATTLAAVTAGLWLVHAYVVSGDAVNYTAYAFVSCEGTVARIVSNNGGLLTITLSGLNVQSTQSSGSNGVTIVWVMTKFG